MEGSADDGVLVTSSVKVIENPCCVALEHETILVETAQLRCSGLGVYKFRCDSAFEDCQLGFVSGSRLRQLVSVAGTFDRTWPASRF